MGNLYGYKFTSQFGEYPSDDWASCLTGISGEQMASGLRACAERYPEWPPGAAQFRALCLGLVIDGDDYDASWQHRRIDAATRDWNAQEAQRRLKLDDTTGKERARAKGRETLDSLKNLFRYTPDEQTEDSEEAAA
jgi:hypothetical protein